MMRLRDIIAALLLCLTVTVSAQVYVYAVVPIRAEGISEVSAILPMTYLKDEDGVIIPDSIPAGRIVEHTPIVPPIVDISDVHYFFENNAADSSGNAADATVTNMAYGSTSPAQGSYYGSFISIATLFEIPGTFTTPFSVSCWVRQPNTGGYYEIMSPWATAGTWEKWRFWIDGVVGDLELRGYQNTTSIVDYSASNTGVWVSSSTWRHIVFTYDNGPVKFYLDGVDVTASGDLASTWSTSDMDLNATIMAIGQYFNGDIDDFSKYSRILSSTQVTTLFSGGPGTRLTE